MHRVHAARWPEAGGKRAGRDASNAAGALAWDTQPGTLFSGVWCSAGSAFSFDA